MVFQGGIARQPGFAVGSRSPSLDLFDVTDRSGRDAVGQGLSISLSRHSLRETGPDLFEATPPRSLVDGPYPPPRIHSPPKPRAAPSAPPGGERRDMRLMPWMKGWGRRPLRRREWCLFDGIAVRSTAASCRREHGSQPRPWRGGFHSRGLERVKCCPSLAWRKEEVGVGGYRRTGQSSCCVSWLGARFGGSANSVPTQGARALSARIRGSQSFAGTISSVQLSVHREGTGRDGGPLGPA